MPTCPCCSDQLLHHVRPGSTYWFCRSCWAEMPTLESYIQARDDRTQIFPQFPLIKQPGIPIR